MYKRNFVKASDISTLANDELLNDVVINLIYDYLIINTYIYKLNFNLNIKY